MHTHTRTLSHTHTHTHTLGTLIDIKDDAYAEMFSGRMEIQKYDPRTDGRTLLTWEGAGDTCVFKNHKWLGGRFIPPGLTVSICENFDPIFPL